MINIIITSYGEPKATAKAIDSFLKQDIKERFRITVIDPFPKIEEFLKKRYGGKVDFFLDPGEGKSYALNLFLEQIYSKNEQDIIILTDGDVYVSENAVKEIVREFKDKKVGCVTGKPTLLNPRDNFFGYASHVAFGGVDNVRKKLSKKGKFLECSGYLFAIRNGVLQGFPLETSEDAIISYLFWKKGYKIKYLPQVDVYVLNPQNWKDFKLQKIRNIKGHENLNKIAPDMPRTKSFLNEVKGTWFALTYPKNIREILFTIPLFLTRLYLYINAFYNIKFKKQEYSDGWRAIETESTKPLD